MVSKRACPATRRTPGAPEALKAAKFAVTLSEPARELRTGAGAKTGRQAGENEIALLVEEKQQLRDMASLLRQEKAML
ncbi:MAG: hypothetical protein Q7T04_05960, partial [Dehalococcoidia bacterium]|nr:hypothetical protein [Dehalococcoidia bacterium]